MNIVVLLYSSVWNKSSWLFSVSILRSVKWTFIKQVMNSMRCFIIQQRTARTSVYTMILTYFLTYPLCAMTHEVVQLKTPLTTVADNNLCPSPTLQCHPSFSFPFSLRAFGCSLAFLAFFPAVPDPKSDQFWCSNCYSFNLETRPKHISNAFLWLFLIVGSLLCLFDILSGQCIFKILWRHFRWNASSFSSYFSVVLQSSYLSDDIVFLFSKR